MLAKFALAVFSILVMVARLAVIQFLFNAILAPAFGLPAITLVVAWALVTLPQVALAPQFVGVLKSTMAVVWGPQKDKALLESYLEGSKSSSTSASTWCTCSRLAW